MRAETASHISLRMKEAFGKISPFIEKHTRLVCPGCAKVCCANRHGSPEEEDFLFFAALGVEYLPEGAPDPQRLPKDELCCLLRATGCTLPRWRRPFRCTWYFCEPLLASMRADKGREYRRFMAEFEGLMAARREFLAACGRKNGR